MFSRQIPDGDTLLAGEMAGVDDGLVIQELSRPEELEKLQHELAKQVSKLAELGELKWLERLEAIETEELVVRVQELKRKAASIREKLRELVENGQQTEVKKLKEELEKLGIKNVEEANAEELKKQEEEKIKALEWLGKKLEEIGKLQSAEEIQKLRELGGDLGLAWLEEKKLEELKEAKSAVVTKVGLKELEALGLEDEIKLEGIEAGKELELAQKLKKLETKLESSPALPEKKKKLGELQTKLEELAAIRELKALGVFSAGAEKVKKLGGTVEELAAIRELKGTELEEQLRTLAEVKEVKALVESRKDRGLEIQEELTERIRGLERRLVWSEAQKLEEIQELTQRQRIRPENEPQAVKKAASMLEMIRVLRKLGQLDELIPEEQLRTLAEVKEMLGLESMQKLGELTEVKALKALERSSEWEKLKEKKLALVAKLKNRGAFWVGAEEKTLGKLVKEIKALEELTEIAEKRGVATTLKAALANAMETTKNRGWTDYLNSLDSSKVTDAVRELIAAEKIRAWARDINNLDVDERAMVAGAFARAVEGAEVIEVRAIGSTSVMLNACYDLLTDGIGVVPNSAYPTLSSPAHPQLPAYVPSTHLSL
ncbi:hypothetical protein GH714_043029 [Hevea brasiliensis]|uniref:Msp4/OMP-like domain-containing protein n=1 Tax=Hevea brasiliensis TaxID=3981 RepID=A0A6A6K171_HEVBR|nr:hypothetical protein GH714_043029 [Hevea brasiliensis]